jgi:ABC-type Fe3+-hydroxamate transport system substrate-binding protein
MQSTTKRPARAHLIDALGRPVPTEPSAERILSLIPSVTECLFDLEVGQRVVGRTDYCISPADAVRGLPSVGGPKSVDPDAVARLAPDLVLANAEENDRRQVEALIEAGFRVHVALPRTLGDAARFLDDLGTLVRAEALSARLALELRQVAAGPPRPPVPTACLIWKGPFMTANADTLTSAILAAGGARNVFAELPNRYPEITQAELAGARPRLVLLPTEPYEFTESDAGEIEALVPGATTAVVQGEWVTWYGSRMVEAIEGLRRLIDPFRQAEATS